MDDELRHLSAGELRSRYAEGSVSPTAYLADTLTLQAEQEPTLHAFVTIATEQAEAEAEAADRRIRERGNAAWQGKPLLGVPLSVKDLTPTAGIRTTRGSLRELNTTPVRDATAVARLREAGAVIFGKTTTSEFGWSASTVGRLGPPTANPWDPGRTAGGSSGGAAAATAVGIGIGAIGTDGAGSIRIPASFCGVVGFKPSYGLIPYEPASSDGLAHIGPLARDVDTAAILTEVMCGRTLIGSATSVPTTGRIGWLSWGQPTDIDRIARQAIEALGYPIEDLDDPFDDPYPHLVAILAAAEAASQPVGADPAADPARMAVVEHGRGLSAADLLRAHTERLSLRNRVDRLLETVAVLAMPTVSIEPFAADHWRPDGPTHDLGWLAWCRAVYPFNLTGHPAVSVPAGFDGAGYPVGLQIVGQRGDDALVLGAARQLQQTRPWRFPSSRLHSHAASLPHGKLGDTL
jgi:aspartyl-tRNA(Asn)/glutamyl-tRNA(Gln) amidotransferase subunit A